MNLSQAMSGLILVAMRLSGLFVFAPGFSSAALPAKVKATLWIALTAAVGMPLVGAAHASLHLGLIPIARELAISFVFGFALSLVLELANSAGQLAGLQMSFTLVNLMDPNSNIETSLFSQMFQLLTITLLVSSGADREVLAAILRTFSMAPLGGTLVRPEVAVSLVLVTGGILLAAVQLLAPIIAATVLVEVAIAFLSRLSPQLPVLALTIPAKTLVGYMVFIGSLSLWSRFIEYRFSSLLDCAQQMVAGTFGA